MCPPRFHERVERIVIALRQLGHINLLKIFVEKPLRCDERTMRQHISDCHEKGPISRIFVQRLKKLAANLRDLFIIAGVGSTSGPRNLDPGGGLTGGVAGDMPQLRADIADNSPFKAVSLVGPIKVHTSAQGRFITGVDKVMDESGYVGLEAATIGPDADIRAMPAC